MGADIKALEKMVEQRLWSAWETLERMPMPKYGRPSQQLAAYPDIVRNTIEAYNRSEVEVRDAPPHPSEIESMDEALRWLLWLDEDERKIIWGRATGVTWRKLERRDGRSDKTLRKVHSRGMQKIIAKLVDEIRNPRVGKKPLPTIPENGVLKLRA